MWKLTLQFSGMQERAEIPLIRLKPYFGIATVKAPCKTDCDLDSVQTWRYRLVDLITRLFKIGILNLPSIVFPGIS